MTDERAHERALRPLWLMTTGAAACASAAQFVTEPGPVWVHRILGLLGISLLGIVLHHNSHQESRPSAVLWLAIGAALVGGGGLGAAATSKEWNSIADDPNVTIRAQVVVTDGWISSRWGRRAGARVLEATARDQRIRTFRRCRVEIRGVKAGEELPAPGTVINVLGRPAGDALRPLLVVPSLRLVERTGDHHVLPLLRDRLARALFAAAGTDVRKIRTAEVAATLSLGRRDLVPAARRDMWRRSGFAHFLAVSGLHVGIVGGSVWLLAALSGAGPKTARLITLVVIPGYAMLAGGSPSALRAALMGVIYLGARFFGRAVLPMAAVVLTILVLLVIEPSMIGDPGFQLTAVITAALVRWVPIVASALPGPTWLTGTAAVPLVAQAAAAPIVGWHFRSLMPGAILSNLVAIPLLAPCVLLAVTATLVAPLWPGAASAVLAVLHHLLALLWTLGGPARLVELIAPAMSVAAVLTLVLVGWFALRAGKRAVWAATAWIGFILVLNLRTILPTPPGPPRVEVLPVGDGAAVLFEAEGDAILADAGRFARQAAILTTDASAGDLRALLASHTDEDHIGGAIFLLRTTRVAHLVLPAWMMTAPEAVPLLRAARTTGTRVVPVARGSLVTLGMIRLEIMWPPASDPPRRENERSLVARIDLGPGTAVLTSDIGRSTERVLSRFSRLAGDVLIVPHHGSRNGTSNLLLDASSPAVALVPAAPGNGHGHPHPEVLERLAARRIATRAPTRDRSCGAFWNGNRWQAFP